MESIYSLIKIVLINNERSIKNVYININFTYDKSFDISICFILYCKKVMLFITKSKKLFRIIQVYAIKLSFKLLSLCSNEIINYANKLMAIIQMNGIDMRKRYFTNLY